MVQRSSKASLIFAWTMLAGVLGLVAYAILGPIVSPGRPTAADLTRGETLIRSQYSNAQTRVGRVSLAPAGRCAMHGSAELVDTGASGTVRQADCVVTITGKDSFSAACS